MEERTTSEVTERTTREVQAVYDEIAEHFSKTRAYSWPEVEDFLEEFAGGRRGLDIGCGNGRHTEHLAAYCDVVYGLDLSRELLYEADARVVSDADITWMQGDAGVLPVQDGSIDTAIYVATIHHLPDRETRVESLRELGRVLTADGIGLVSAWSTAHDRFDADADATMGFDTTVDWTLPGGETVPRFYHIYAPAEFERDIRAAGLSVNSFEISSGNCYARVRK